MNHLVTGSVCALSPRSRWNPRVTGRAGPAAGDEAARAIIERREGGLILLCRSPWMDFFYRRGDQVSSPDETIFRDRLLHGQVPTWLKPIPLPDGLDDGFLLLEVDLPVGGPQ